MAKARAARLAAGTYSLIREKRDARQHCFAGRLADERLNGADDERLVTAMIASPG
jgi:hypothetical protein